MTGDEDLKAILVHNRDEEIEHAPTALEWLRRRMPKFDEELRTYLFTSQPVTQIEDSAEKEPEAPAAEIRGNEDLGVFFLKLPAGIEMRPKEFAEASGSSFPVEVHQRLHVDAQNSEPHLGVVAKAKSRPR